jgi:glycosyltransferase involved in cell wall biosynthesis
LRDVFFVGFANQGELPAYYAAADIFILPSTSQEVSPLVINEAMAMELPVLVSNAVPSARDFVKNGENGYIFKMGDVDELAERVRELAGDKDTTKNMGMESLRLIESWNYETCVLGVLEALKFSAKPKNG